MTSNSENVKSRRALRWFSGLMLMTMVLFAGSVLAQVSPKPTIGGSVFGGGRMANVDGNAYVEMKDGIVDNSIFGGNDISGHTGNGTNSRVAIANATETDITSGNVYGVKVTGGTVTNNVFGGANGYYACHEAETTYADGYASINYTGSNLTDENVVNPVKKIPALNYTSVLIDGGTIGNVYGGGNLAPVGYQGISTGQSDVNIHKGQITGNVFTGGNMASVYVTSNLTVDNTITEGSSYAALAITGGVYGGNDKSGTVSIARTGTNYASDGTTQVPNNATYVLIKGAAQIGGVYGAGNGDYNYDDASWNDCGFSKPDQPAGSFVDINTTGGYIGIVCGGGNSASVGGDSYVLLNTKSETSTANNGDGHDNKHVGVIYGGCNMANVGTESNPASTTVNLAQAKVGTIYGGCNISGDVTGTANVDIHGGLVADNVFGGANGYYGCEGSNGYYGGDFDGGDGVEVSPSIKMPTVKTTNVTISGGQIGTQSNSASVYGGGNFAAVGGSTNNGVVNFEVTTGALIWGSVYGGGNMASVNGYTNFEISGGTINGDVYGGNDKVGVVTGVNRPSGTYSSTAAWYDGYPEKYELSAANAASYVLLTGTPTITGSVFGGGNGDYTYSESWNKCNFTDANKPVQVSAFVDINVDCDASINKVFAGGNNATVGSTSTTTESYTTAQAGKANVYLNVTSNPLADPSTCDNTHQVGTIFGGNNKAQMYVVPKIDLRQGKVGNVYGGGNMGAMAGNNASLDGHGLALSTYVRIPSPNVEVAENIYGGCKAADVTNETYVYLDKGQVDGKIFGANDIAGNVGTANVIIDGVSVVNEVYGGGNGEYCYIKAASFDPEHPQFTVNNDNTTFTVSGRPTTTTAKVEVQGAAKVHKNVYGGGLAGDCVNTIVNLNLTDNGASDAENGILYGMVFGGGRGDIDNIGKKATATCIPARCDDANAHAWGTHVGNVTGTATLNINTIGKMMTETTPQGTTRNAIFGGGHAGDVANAVVNLNTTCKAHIPSIYGGCLASDLTGTTTMNINGASTLPQGFSYNVDTLYGGNDYAGITNATRMTVNSGTFQHVFGAGNGEYNYWSDPKITALGASSSCADTVPYSMDVMVTFNGGTVQGSVYGGGNLGLVGNRDLNPANITSADYGKIVVNVHGGTFNRHIFTGARGTKAMNKKFFGHGTSGDPTIANDAVVFPQHLAYATKVLNMDGGYVKFSVYGGSESVDDGFFWECVGNDSVGSGCGKHYTNTTLRPSSILNIVGGEISKNVYGGGYQGNIYGSVYVNIGYHAVNDSPVWAKHYGKWVDTADAGSMPSYATFEDYKPWVLDIHGRPYDYVEKQTDLTASRVTLGASVYNGSDWGEAGSNAYFYTRGFYGGESNILIDGDGYNTHLNPAYSSLPGMNINYSIIGAGTSTEGGDVNRLITFKNYGDYECPNVSKTIYSIQRADKVILDHVYINLAGDQDAYSAYVSPSYTFCRIDTLIFRVDNIVQMQAPGIYIGNMVSMKDREQSCAITSDDHLYAASDIYPPTLSCDHTDPEFCDLLPSNRGSHYESGETPIIAAANTLVMQNGSYMKVSPFVDKKVNATDAAGFDGMDDPNHNYGHVYGYMYLLAQDNTQSYVYAAEKVDASSLGANDDGFVSARECDNTVGEGDNKEIAYSNVTDLSPNYRSWKVGTKQGTRTRHITIIANAHPDDRQNFSLTGSDPVAATLTENDGTSDPAFQLPGNLAYAKASLELPPATGGSFYVINSISIDRDNGGQITMVDNTFDLNHSTLSGASPSYAAYGLSNPATNINEVVASPNNTFGLMFSSGQNFNTGACWNSTSELTEVPTDDSPIEHRQLTNGSTRYSCWPQTVISGNNFISSQDGYISNAVNGNGSSGVIPTIDFVLTYCKNLSATITRDVVFTMYEFDAAGNYVGPIDVTVTIATVVNAIDDLEAPVLAMYNEGNYNEYVRKVTIPATFSQKQLYLEGIEWHEEKQVIQGYDREVVTESDPVISNPVSAQSQQGDVTGETTTFVDDPSTTVDGVYTQVRHYTITSKVVDGSTNTTTTHTTTYDVTTKRYRENGSNPDSSWFRMMATGSVPADNKHFSVKLSPTEASSDNVNNTLGWYHIEERELDVFDLANKDYHATTGYDLSDSRLTPVKDHQQLNNYDSYDYNADGSVTTDDKTKLKNPQDRLWIGTLDGRATASMDVTLGFNGSLFYEDQYAVPLAWATLHFVAINTNASDDGSHAEQRFDVKVKIRTRSEGDTIYMAPDSVLIRQVVTSAGVSANVQLASFEKQQIEQLKKIHPTWSYRQCYDARLTGLNVEDDKRIKNNPARYVQSFKAAMMTFVEGDVLDIMETITINDGSNPISVSGEDYSVIPIIRYSGSHCRFPGLGCANYNPLIVVSGDGMLSMRNVSFNGSGCTRVKAESPRRGGSTNEAGEISTLDDFNGQTVYGYGYQQVPDASDICLNVGGIYFNENHGPDAIGTREKTLLFADAPMVVVTGNGTANFAKNVTFTNNFSKAQNPAVEFTGSETTGNIERAQRVVYGGGALCLKAETIDTTWTGTGNSRTVSSISINKHNPQLILGDMTKVYDNAVVDWSNVENVYEERHISSTAQQVDARESGVGPRNYGAGIYVDGGTLNLGTGAEQIHMEIKRNYYLQAVPTISDKKFVVTNAPFKVLEKTANRKGVEFQFTHYELDTTRADNKSGKLALSNVYLMRTPGTTAEGACSEAIAKVRLDKRSDLAYFPNTFADGSSVGISKWFPGYTPWDMQPRDTIAFARIAKGKSDASISEKVYNANVFFNDSSYFHQTSGNLAFKLDSENPNNTLYWNTVRSSVTNKDLVYLFYHSTVNQYSLYFQRCATFGKGVTQGDPCTIAGTSQKLTNFMKVSDSVYYRWDPQATCSGNTDTLFFRLGGGFFPYSYRWIDMTDGGEGNLMRERYTTGTAAIASNAALRRKSEVDSLTMVDMILPPGESQKVFTYLIKGNDLTGHCEVSQQVQVKVLQNLDVKTYTDVNDFLGHGSTYVMANPGLDSSNFHDYSETIDGVTQYYYPTTTLNSDGERTSTSLTRTQSTDPKYLRTYKLYSIHPSIYPVAYAQNASKPVEVWSNTEINITANNAFCPGDVVELRPKPVSNKNFVMWDYDASANENANFVVSSDESLNSPVAYYEPNDYWWQVVTTKPDGYQEDYYGNVTISNNEGLAWLISVVNGYNGQEAHTFRFDQIKINANLDMSAHKWTPLGAENNQFEGTISSADTAYPVLIQGIIANEASIPYMGVFGYTDNAKINNINFGDVFVKGNHYVGGLVGRSTFNTEIRKVNFNAQYSGDPAARNANSFGATLVGTNCIGGVVGTAANTKIDECSVSDMKLMGNCIYVGGVAGLVTAPESGATVTSNIFTNNSATAVDQSRLAALYAGGAIGYSEPSSKRGIFGRKDAATPALLMNNYIEFQSGDHSHHVGGLVGNASDIDIRNNYVYGTIKGIEQMGGLVAMSGYNVNIDHCYFVSGSAHSAVGIDEFGSAHDVTTFYGAGNQVRLDERVSGYNNLTRALNGWVKRNSSDNQEFRTWRSDLDNENNGYPIFGTPDVIQIYDTLVQTVCDIFDWDGIELNESGIYTVHIVDSLDYLDSTATLILTVNYHDETSIVDSVELFSDYANHGFSFSAQQLMMLLAGNRGAMVLNLTDTLQTINGCDSIVNLTLHFYSKDVSVDEAEHALSDVKVYPNPTRGIVHVEGADIRNIEVYDATSRCVLRKEVNGDETVLDLTNKSTGSYYIRVNTANGSVVKKLIKK